LVTQKEAEAAGADYVGLDDYLQKLKMVGLMLM
jgi:ribosomal protein L1